MLSSFYPPSRPQRIGEVLDSSFRIFRATLVKALPYSILATLAGQLPGILNLARGRPQQPPSYDDGVWWIAYVVGLLAVALLWSAMILRQRAMAEGEPVSARTELAEALRRLPALVLLIVGVGLVSFLGLLLFIIPGLYLMIALSLSWPALILARKGVEEAMRYSLRLVRGNWWRLVAIYTVGTIVVLVIYMVPMMLAAVIATFAGAEDVALVTALFTVIVVAIGAIAWPFSSAVVLAVFAELQVRREGTDLERRIA
jgi:hypothetical protein